MVSQFIMPMKAMKAIYKKTLVLMEKMNIAERLKQ